MRLISVTATDAAGIRAVQCRLPDDVQARWLAVRLAQLMRLPILGPDDQPILYGFIEKGGELLASEATLDAAGLPDDADLRLVPELIAGETDASIGGDAPFGPAGSAPEIEILEEIELLPCSQSVRRPDIRIDATVHQDIVGHASEDHYTECAGLLLGRVSDEDGERVIHVTAAVPAIGARGTRATVRITLESWEAMLRVWEADYSDLRILGWYHSHAGWGVFLSELDVFIHRHFFPHPDMIACVVDATSGRDGFFFWQDGNISLRPSYGLVGSPRNVEVLAAPRPRGRRPDLRDVLITVLAAGVIWAGVTAIRIDRTPYKPKPAPAVVAQQKPAGAPSSQPKAADPKPAQPAPPADRIYVVSRGDNPWIICNRFYGDGSLSEELARYNNIADMTSMQVGQEIRLPSKEVLMKLGSQ